MQIFLHLGLFIGAILVLWLLSGVLIEATDRVARRYNRPGFAVAFFLLGFLTSISEISVAVNSTIEGVPQISAGNLIGASLVIFLLLIPLLAVVGRGIPMHGILSQGTIILLLFLVFLPSILLIDGSMDRHEGLLLIALYIALVVRVQRGTRKHAAGKAARAVEQELFHHLPATMVDVGKITLAAICIFFAGHVLVEESVYFSSLLGTPPSLIGLLLLSLGTNIPECVIAVRCVTDHHKDIAFGDYMGSAAANAPIIGMLVLVNGTFTVNATEFLTTGLFLAGGLTLFYLLARSGRFITRREGIIILSLYVLFVITQITVIALSGPSSDVMHSAPPL